MVKRYFAEYSRYYRIIKQNYIVENVTDTTFELKDIDSRYMNNFLDISGNPVYNTIFDGSTQSSSTQSSSTQSSSTQSSSTQSSSTQSNSVY